MQVFFRTPKTSAPSPLEKATSLLGNHRRSTSRPDSLSGRFLLMSTSGSCGSCRDLWGWKMLKLWYGSACERIDILLKHAMQRNVGNPHKKRPHPSVSYVQVIFRIFYVSIAVDIEIRQHGNYISVPTSAFKDLPCPCRHHLAPIPHSPFPNAAKVFQSFSHRLLQFEG